MSCDYKIKYLKYKNKYQQLKKKLQLKNILIGGSRNEIEIPHRFPDTYSFLFMPLILLPFTDIYMEFPPRFNELLMAQFRIHLGDIKHELGKFYTQHDVDLNNRETIIWINIDGKYCNYDDVDKKIHLDGESQERILKSVVIKDGLTLYNICERLIFSIIHELKGQKIIIYIIR